MSSRLPRRAATRVLAERLATVPNLTVYVRRVGFVLDVDHDVPSPTVSASDQRVRPYVVIHPSVGADGPDQRLNGQITGRVWGPQVTCVVGDETALDSLVDRVTDAVVDWRPTFGDDVDVQVGRFRLLDGYDPGPSRRDDDEAEPPRFWTPLMLRLPIYS